MGRSLWRGCRLHRGLLLARLHLLPAAEVRGWWGLGRGASSLRVGAAGSAAVWGAETLGRRAEVVRAAQAFQLGLQVRQGQVVPGKAVATSA